MGYTDIHSSTCRNVATTTNLKTRQHHLKYVHRKRYVNLVSTICTEQTSMVTFLYNDEGDSRLVVSL